MIDLTPVEELTSQLKSVKGSVNKIGEISSTLNEIIEEIRNSKRVPGTVAPYGPDWECLTNYSNHIVTVNKNSRTIFYYFKDATTERRREDMNELSRHFSKVWKCKEEDILFM